MDCDFEFLKKEKKSLKQVYFDRYRGITLSGWGFIGFYS